MMKEAAIMFIICQSHQFRRL